ncbi:DNA-(apurinic or apyrimidinic site) lyase /endonuclease III [Heliophilum fasciatum]|uniref:Endonuclease III n=2 Tax=Heliophilum fasciatum TaxID=35700 RepID=A0A4V2SY00_9FIRM|nr:endonuclease III [Heliophilum fasciatum]MCW2277179.1 endonuclease-3 [Heliophilum fasciatum]TCP68186.1 DNA-(apurinic or apyrimidinic site) lyase /endonuclease III [Heliophilum fasciatum]
MTVSFILSSLARLYPDAQCALLFRNPFELLIATILAAQATDKSVNKITPELFRKYPTPADFLPLSPEELEASIRTIGLYKNKARHILATCTLLVSRFGGEVPADRASLESLPGVGRKTANVVLSNAFGVPAIAVDTHVFRVANRLGLAQAATVLETERQLMGNIPEEQWTIAHHWLITHGRQVCHARKPACSSCDLHPVCADYHKKTEE